MHLALDNPFFKTAMGFADHCTASTMPLAEEMARHVEPGVQVTVLPNLLSHEVYFRAQASEPAYSREREEDGRLVVFYGSATKAHKQCFYDILLPALLALLEEHAHVDLHLVGFFAGLPESYLASGRIKLLEPTSDYLAYLDLVR